jgi:DNA-binding transcriptional LysR family regulator
MKIEFNDLQLLDLIEKEGSFSKAAEKIHRTRSAITQSIQKLEEQLGYPVFDRSQHKIQFSSEGRFLLEKGRHILRQMEQLKEDVTILEQGYEAEFSIAYDDIISFEAILSLIQDFQAAISPSISIRLHREVLNGVWDALVQNRATLAIGATGDPPVGLPCSQKMLGHTTFVFAISPKHPLAKETKSLTIEDLASTCSIVTPDTSQQLGKRSGGTFPGQTIIRVPNMDAKIQAHVQGVGVGYLPKHRIKNHLARGLLVEKNTPNPRAKVFLNTAWRTDAPSKILAWFLEHLEKEGVKERLFS